MTVNKNKKRVSSAAPPSTLRVDFCNIRGLHTNINAVHHHLETEKPAMLFLTETQISCPADTSYLHYPGYNLEHLFLRKAGVCMYIRGDICCRRLNSLEDKDLSIMWIRVDYGGTIRVYACLYRSHRGELREREKNVATTQFFERIQEGTDTVLQQFPSAEVIVLGDFNAHHNEWLGSSRTDHAGRAAYNLALAYGFSQLVPGPTRIPDIESHEPSLLDLLLTTHSDNYQVSVGAPLGSSDHCLVKSEVPLAQPVRSRTAETRKVWHYGSADWDGLREFFASYPWWRLCFSTADPDTCADAVADVVLQGMECFIPSSVVPVGGPSQPWFDRLSAEASSLKESTYRTWTEARARKDPNTAVLKKKYNASARSSKKEIARAKFRFIGRIGDRLANYPSGSRAFWSLAKAVEGNFCRPSLPPLRTSDDSLAHTAKAKADLLAALFAKNSTLDDGGATPPTIPRCESSMPEIRFTQTAVRRALRSLDVRKSSGPDGIPAVVLKTCAPELSPPLTRLFALSYTTGCVPSSWKTALVHPIPKKGDRSDPSNYRPIAITSLLSKVMERLINTQLLRYLEGHQLISDRQYGFRHDRSAGDLLVYLTHRWAEAVESKGEALAVSLDIAKAFDRVWHRALLAKLPSYGIPEGLCNWIASFLSDRSIRVAVDGCCSDVKPIDAGVPQGCVLSPTLFILHINDMLQTGSIHCYADDSTGDAQYAGYANIPRSVVEESRIRLVSEVENSLMSVSEWGRLNLVQFNPTKTQVCVFSAKKAPFVVAPQFQNTSLTITKSIGILGVDISSDVQFRGHLESKAKLASKKLGVLNRSKRYFTPRQRLTLYKGQVRPHMEYCSHLWAGAPAYQLDPLDSVQRRATRIVDDPNLTDGLEPLSLRRDIGSLCVFYRLYNGECSEELFDMVPTARFHHRTARRRCGAHPHILEPPLAITQRFSRTFLLRTIRLWNELPTTVFPQRYNMGLFKKGVNRALKAGNASATPLVLQVSHRRR